MNDKPGIAECPDCGNDLAATGWNDSLGCTKCGYSGNPRIKDKGIAEEIKKALQRYDEAEGMDEISRADYMIQLEAKDWLRTLLEENQGLRKIVESYTRIGQDMESDYEQLERQHLAQLGQLSRELEQVKHQLEVQTKAAELGAKGMVQMSEELAEKDKVLEWIGGNWHDFIDVRNKALEIINRYKEGESSET